MAIDAIDKPPDGLVGGADPDPLRELTQAQRAEVHRHLLPGEFIVWAGRGTPRPAPSIRAFPALFAAILCGCSGFALMVLFGIYGVRKMDPREMLFLLGLAPAALGAVTAAGLASGWTRHRLWQDRIARSFYVLTDVRAIVGLERRWDRSIVLVPWPEGSFDRTRCIEHGDGTGSVYFMGDGQVIEPHWAFEGIRDPARVDELIREVLLGEKPEPGADLREL